jgi:hypothetical protein
MAEDPNNPGVAGDEPSGDELEEPTGAPEDGDEGDGDESEWTPPTREEYERQQAEHKAALEAERAKLARARRQAERLRKGGTPAAGDGTPAGEGGQGGQEGVVDWRGRAVRASARAELLDRGADSDMVGLMLAALRPERIEFDDNGDPELDDYLDDMEERYPKLFAKTPAAPAEPARPRPGRVDQGAASGARPVRPKLGIGQQIIANSQAATRAGRRGI